MLHRYASEYVEALTSVKTQLPYEYYVLPFCHKGVNLQQQDALNLGEVLRGSRIYDTPYSMTMGEDQTCKILCQAKYDTQEIQAFALMIEEEYRVNLLLDNLPVAMAMYAEDTTGAGPTTKLYDTGYPIGHEEKDTKRQTRGGKRPLFLFNHLRFTVLYNEDALRGKRRIVGFEVEPFSDPINHCNHLR
ncbi:hypothetical protein T484DRAFT_1804134 [Baffinella frigidus]|nr:hypothetical protein T484DRAFT_1804134 [Cryptophyta sp. CCMP2293]